MTARFIDQAGAKRFFVERVVVRAEKEHVPLSDAERQMLAWSEAEMTPETAQQVNARFETETTDSDFEAKVSNLIRRAYSEDVERDQTSKDSYREAYRVLSGGDHYILVMIRQALGLRLFSQPLPAARSAVAEFYRYPWFHRNLLISSL